MEKITEQDILICEFNKYFKQKIMTELQISLQSELNPNEKSARRPIRFNSSGQAVSWEEITRAEHIKELKEKLEGIELVLKIIKNYD